MLLPPERDQACLASFPTNIFIVNTNVGAETNTEINGVLKHLW
jgi:hypothetical protein